MTPRKIARYGWRPSLPQKPQFTETNNADSATIPVVDNRNNAAVPIFDQGQLGSCTANALARALMYALLKAGAPMFTPSRLMLYLCERMREGTIDSDAGAMSIDGVHALQHNGVCTEELWPYDITKFTLSPPQSAWDDAAKHRLLQYWGMEQRAGKVFYCLQQGLGIAYGFSVGESFESQTVADTGIVPIPGTDESIVGGHEVYLNGYTNDLKKVHSQGAALALPEWAKSIPWWGIVENSWGTSWGDKGSFYVPLSDILDPNRSSDLTSLRLVTPNPALAKP